MLFGAFCVFLLAGRLNLSGLQTEGFLLFVYSLTASVHIFFFLSGIVMAIIYAKIQDTRYKIQDILHYCPSIICLYVNVEL
ncbi:MAG: hypothetical protein LBG80_17675 [Bacteroidales bacterium]|nr:hypothetical protein [Bacteroidales bacterium]